MAPTINVVFLKKKAAWELPKSESSPDPYKFEWLKSFMQKIIEIYAFLGN